MPPMRKSPAFVAKKNLSCSTCCKPYATNKTLETHVKRMHKQPEDHGDEVETNQENPVPVTTSEEQDNVVNDLT